MLDINVSQNRKITLLFSLIAATAGALAILTYLQKIKHDKENKEIAKIDLELKMLQLAELKKRNGNS
jgi:hypothetical protein